uniref:Pentatricopeptide repeat-containing protein At4g20090-like n=1 Tax=Elaeis guineensis var. tenera TaxID=51953 RepID=A0A6I9RGV9_ELAGV|nr:pentatricopeptide repeat-containing protein At4g20090-like [Elaeis guineensis]
MRPLASSAFAVLALLMASAPPLPLRPDIYSYSTLIDALACAGCLDALVLHDKMQLDEVTPSTVTFNSLLYAFYRAGDLLHTAKLTLYMLLKDCPPTLTTYNTLIHGLCLRGHFDDAIALQDYHHHHHLLLLLHIAQHDSVNYPLRQALPPYG